jgi:methionine-S-sulfoxide reductase
MHDPTQLNRQGPDVGDDYRSAIFYFNAEQQKIALQVRNQKQKELDQPIVTEISPAGQFYKAEEYHQKFTEKTGMGMCHVQYAPIK